MRKSTILSGVFFLLLSLSAAQLTAQKAYTPQAIREDLAFLYDAFIEGQPGVSLYTTTDSLKAYYEQLGIRLKGDSVSWEQTQLVVRLAIAAIKDGHTSVKTPFYDDKTRVLPFSTFALGDRVFIAGNYSADTTLVRGTEIQSINGEPVSNTMRIGRLMATRDGYARTFEQAYADVLFSRIHTLLFGEANTYKLEVIPYDQKDEKTVRVFPLTREELQEQAAAKKPTVSARPVHTHKTMALLADSIRADLAILRMRGFPKRGYKKFYKKTFKWLEENKIEHLVIDLRYNTGGNLSNMNYLLPRLVDSTYAYSYRRRKGTRLGPYFNFKGDVFRFMATLRYDVFPGFKHGKEGDQKIRIKRVKPHKQKYDGQLWLFTNGFTFSAASQCASFLKDRTNAIAIGEETGGSATQNCGGSFITLVLPNTGIQIRFPLFVLEYDVQPGVYGRGVIPDHSVEYTLKARVERQDLEMQELYKLLDKR